MSCDLLNYIPLFLCLIMLGFISFVSWMTYKKKAPLIKVRQKVQRKPITKSEEDEWAHENKKNRSNIDLD